MTYETLKAARSSISNFIPSLRRSHHHVKLPNGKWCNTLGVPGPRYTNPEGKEFVVHNVRGNVWHMVPA